MLIDKVKKSKKQAETRIFLENCKTIIECPLLEGKEDEKLNLIINGLSEIESDAGDILIKILANKSRDRLELLKKSSSLLGDSLYFIEKKHRGEYYKHYKDLLIDGCRAFFKKNYPTVVCNYRKFEEE